MAGPRLRRGDETRDALSVRRATTGLHLMTLRNCSGRFASCRRGPLLVVIEHNLDVIRAADWIIDLGPEAETPAARLYAAARRGT